MIIHTKLEQQFFKFLIEVRSIFDTEGDLIVEGSPLMQGYSFRTV